VVVERTRRVFDDFLRVDEAVLRYERYVDEVSNSVRRLDMERGDAGVPARARCRRFGGTFVYPMIGTVRGGPGGGAFGSGWRWLLVRRGWFTVACAKRRSSPAREWRLA